MMKELLKQVGICIFFVALFVGMQIGAQFALGYGYAFYGQLSGWQISANELSALTNEFLADNTDWYILISGCATILAVWLFSKVRRKKFVQDFNLVPFNTNNLLPIVLLAIGCGLVISGYFFLLPETLMDSYDSHMGGNEKGIVVMLLSTAVVAPIVEELIFRGILMSRLSKVMNIVLAALFSTMTFGLLHGNIVQITYAVVLGLIMSFIAVRCASLLASCFFHIIVNVIGSLSITQMLLGDSFIVNIIAGIIGLVIIIAAIIWICKINDGAPNTAAVS